MEKMSTAEVNLDDLFRKRDKKKKTAKSTKFSKIDNAELASHLDAVNSNNNLILNDDEQQQQLQFENDNLSSLQTTITQIQLSTVSDLTANNTTTNNKSNGNNDDGDDEWKNFESDENRNYSGLKINFLRTNESDEENNTEFNGEVEKKSNCPWLAPSNKISNNDDENATNHNEDENKEENKNEKEEIVSDLSKPTVVTTQSAGGAYVPPYLRSNQQQQQQQQQQTDKQPAASSNSTSGTTSGGSYVPPHLRKSTTPAAQPAQPSKDGFQSTFKHKKNQPNINDECEFPSLGDMKPVDIKTGSNASENKFEQPKRSSKLETHSNTSNKIDIENKFNALSS